MSQDYNYDEQGQFFPYFVVTITGLVTLPLTYSLLRPSKELENTAPRIQSNFRPKDADLIDSQRRKQKRRELKLKRIIFAITGWLVMAWMVYLMIVTARTVTKIWDPYEVLGISRSASEKQIKVRYRNLALTDHPDKAQPDPERNLTMEVINERWVEIVKAYKSLTDEEIRNNYLQYGHPDGKQSFSIGIALPKWIVTEGHGKYVLILYGFLLGIFLPYLVGKWWYGQQRVTRENVLVQSAGNIFREYEPEMTEGQVVGTLSCGEEYKDILKGHKLDAGSSKLEQKVLADGDAASFAGGLSAKDRKMLEGLDDATRRKVLALLWAYLGRVELEDRNLNDEKFDVAPTALVLNEAYTTIALAYGNTQPVLSAYHTSQNIIQAMAPGSSPLLQLPHFTTAIAKAVEGENARTHLSIQEFMAIPAEQRRKLAVGPELLSRKQYDEAIRVAQQVPALKVEKAFFKVTGEKYITPSSLVQFVVKTRVIPPGSSNIPEVNQSDLEDVDPAEGDLDALHGRKKMIKTPEGEKLINAEDEKPIVPPLAYGPYFPRDHSPKWHIFLADSKQGKIAVPPSTFVTFDKPLFDEDGKPTFNVQTLKMQFGAPPQPGRYTFVMHLLCDSYVGMDTKMEVTLVIDDPSKAEKMREEEEISEPEDDSIAGQMKQLRSGSKKTDYSSDESETDEDESDSETDTDTDTDEE